MVNLFELYRAADGWRWRFRAANYKIIAASSEAYNREADALDSITLIKAYASAAPVSKQ
ncbi:MAG: hypothetical protein OHK0024_28330 [Thalassobaculales bacterium]